MSTTVAPSEQQHRMMHFYPNTPVPLITLEMWNTNHVKFEVKLSWTWHVRALRYCCMRQKYLSIFLLTLKGFSLELFKFKTWSILRFLYYDFFHTKYFFALFDLATPCLFLIKSFWHNLLLLERWNRGSAKTFTALYITQHKGLFCQVGNILWRVSHGQIPHRIECLINFGMVGYCRRNNKGHSDSSREHR